MKTREEKEAKKKKGKGLYIVSGLALTIGAIILTPKAINHLSEKMYTPPVPSQDDEDEQEPEVAIEKKEQSGDTVPAEEGAPDGNLQ